MKTRGIPTRDPRYLFGNLYPNRLEVFIGENVTFTSKIDGTKRVFQIMQPGGTGAWPPAIEFVGLSKKTVHGGFFVFGDAARDEAAAWARAEEKLSSAYMKAGLMDVAKRGMERRIEKKPDSAKSLFMLGQLSLCRSQSRSEEIARGRLPDLC